MPVLVTKVAKAKRFPFQAAVERAGETRALRRDMHRLRHFRNRCDHDHLPDMTAAEKPELVHAAYRVGVAMIDAALV
jgi:hypothetical protein